MSTTPTTPQWAIITHGTCRKLYRSHVWVCNLDGIGDDRDAQEILSALNHAPPPAAQPTDEAKLREVIENTILAEFAPSEPTEWTTGLAHRLTAALAPHLSQRESGDSELAKELRDMLAELSDVCDGNYYELVKSAKALINRYDKSAQRGEAKP